MHKHKQKILNDEKTFKREISAFKNIKDNYPKYLLTLDFDNTNIEGIQKLNVIDWLLGIRKKEQQMSGHNKGL